MAYIQPDSVVQFYGDLGLSPNYENTLYFPSVSAKDSYFDGITPITTATALSYSRQERGFIRVEKPMSTMINAGYMRFKNSSFENKWFYAFIKNVEYINNITTQVNFELDVMMTWMGVFQLGQCFIERQHTLNDGVGNNIAYEGISLGPYVTELQQMYPPSEYVIILYKTYNPEKDGTTLKPSAQITHGTYIPIISYAYPIDATNLELLQNRLDVLTSDNRIDEVIGLKLAPIEWVNPLTASVPYRHNNIQITKPYSTIGGSTYSPRNNKLYTYPYKYLEVDNCEGQKAVYKYEFFNSLPDTTSQGTCDFEMFGSGCTPEINVMCVPLSYNNVPHAYDEGIKMSDFPSLAWNVDAYKAYLAQRDSSFFGELFTPLVSGMITGGIIGAAKGGAVAGGAGAIGGAIGGAIKGGAIGGFSAIGHGASGQLISDTLNELRSGEQPSRMPNETRGSLSSNLMVQIRQKGFYFRAKSITKNYAMMIDDFFDMYGYAIREKGTPNMNARPNWTFVKTKGCVVHGNLPADDGAIIEGIFDNGVRFWKNHNNIGNYSLNNAPA